MKTASFVLIAGVLLSAGPSFAWNGYGHMTVAAVSYKKLNPAARQKVDALLKLNPDYPVWVANASPQNRALIAFMTASTWADKIRNDATHSSVGDEPSGPSAARNIGYADNLVHPYWHYINIPFSPDGTALKPPVAPNIRTQITAFRAALASPSTSDDVKSYDLVWLLHLVGDVHQPLHSISRFDHEQPDGDRGGTLVAMCAAPCKYNLHFFWDDALGTSPGPEAAIKEASQLPAPDRRLAAIADEATWVDESFQLAKTSVYVDPIGVGPGPFTVDTRYVRQAHDIAAKRVALAGARLANLLNEALK
jgi:hypothetical protein